MKVLGQNVSNNDFEAVQSYLKEVGCPETEIKTDISQSILGMYLDRDGNKKLDIPSGDLNKLNRFRNVSCILAKHGLRGYDTELSCLSLPSNFETAPVLSLVFEMEMKANGVVFGKIKQEIFNFTTAFSLSSPNGTLLAKAEGKVDWVDAMEVRDGSGQFIGSIKQNVTSSIMSARNQYEVFDAQGNKVAISSEEWRWTGNEYTVKGMDGSVILKLEKSAFQFKLFPSWSLEYKKNPKVDPRLLLFIPAFKTLADSEKKKS